MSRTGFFREGSHNTRNSSSPDSTAESFRLDDFRVVRITRDGLWFLRNCLPLTTRTLDHFHFSFLSPYDGGHDMFLVVYVTETPLLFILLSLGSYTDNYTF